MHQWINALADHQSRGEACVLVTIIEERGSTPRNAGSKMVVTTDRIFETIGGGHLEFKAMELAREMLEPLGKEQVRFLAQGFFQNARRIGR